MCTLYFYEFTFVGNKVILQMLYIFFLYHSTNFNIILYNSTAYIVEDFA